jgi:hypothetical protein
MRRGRSQKGVDQKVDISLKTRILGGEDQGRPDFCELHSWAMNRDCPESARLDSRIGSILRRPNQGPGRRVWSPRSTRSSDAGLDRKSIIIREARHRAPILRAFEPSISRSMEALDGRSGEVVR